jgi:hypothetical protein
MNIQDIDDLIHTIETTPNITKDEINLLVRLTTYSIVIDDDDQTIEEHKSVVIDTLIQYKDTRERPIFWNIDISLEKYPKT